VSGGVSLFTRRNSVSNVINDVLGVMIGLGPVVAASYGAT
jgi:hypothetical protein